MFLAVPIRKEKVRLSASPGTDNRVDEINIEEDHFAMSSSSNNQQKESLTQEDSGIFYRSVVFSPEVPVRLDYHGKLVNIEQVKLNFLVL